MLAGPTEILTIRPERTLEGATETPAQICLEHLGNPADGFMVKYSAGMSGPQSVLPSGIGVYTVQVDDSTPRRRTAGQTKFTKSPCLSVVGPCLVNIGTKFWYLISVVSNGEGQAISRYV